MVTLRLGLGMDLSVGEQVLVELSSMNGKVEAKSQQG